MNGIRAFLFDFGDTLIDEDIFLGAAADAAVRAVLSHYGLGGATSDYLSAYHSTMQEAWRSYGHLPAREKEVRVRHEGLRAFIAGLGCDPSEASIDRAFAALVKAASLSPSLFPRARETLLGLKANGMRLGILSNGLAAYTWGSLYHHRLAELFEVVFISEDAGIEKPDPSYFARAANALGVSATETVMVGNRLYEDVFGAKRSGMRAIWIDRKKPIPQWEVVPDYAIHEIGDISTVMRDLT